MRFGRRIASLLALLAVLGVPALGARALCLGRACERHQAPSSEVPFCSLPDGLERRIAAGFYEGRSPEVLAVAAAPGIAGGTPYRRRDPRPQWPALGAPTPEVPVVFSGTGVRAGARVPRSTGIEDVAPTLAEVIGLDLPFPQVRSGRPVAGVATGERPRLAVLVVVKGAGSDQLASSPTLARLLEEGAGTMQATVPSLPADPTAGLATVGTGGLPSEHGITGPMVRNDAGELAPAWGPGAPVSVISTLADDLDEVLRQRPVIGIAADSPLDRVLIGGRWYVGGDRDLVAPSGSAEAVASLLQRGFGSDRVPDFLAVTLGARRVERALAGIVRTVRAAVPQSVFAVTATGAVPARARLDAARVARMVDAALEPPAKLIEAVVPGGVYVDQKESARLRVDEDEVARALRSLTVGGRKLFADVFPAIAVAFARYC